jgi:hypothetical protein
MTLKQAYDNLYEFYAGDDSNHGYIDESWEMFKKAAQLKDNNIGALQTSTDKQSAPSMNSCLCSKCSVRKRAACPIDNLC